MDNYWYWIDHGEVEPKINGYERDHPDLKGMYDVGLSNKFEQIIFDVGYSYFTKKNFQFNQD